VPVNLVYVKLGHTAQETPDFIASNLWPPNSPDLNPVDYEIWALMQRRFYHWQIHCMDELKQRLIDVWCSLKQSIFDEAILTSDKLREDIERVFLLKEER